MSGISKRISGSWVSGDYGIMKTDTDTITTLPADIYANAATATVGLKGQATQSGTPTPVNPVMPQGTGERTGNWFDRTGEISSYFINSSGAITSISPNVWFVSDFIPVQPNTTYTVTYNSVPGSAAYHAFYDENKVLISVIQMETYTFTTPNNTKYMRFSYRDGSYDIMLNLGSTAKPYEPYGYKIPISSNSTTTNVYLGEVETTRKIRKLVLTGEEEWTQSGAASNTFYCRVTGYLRQRINITICSHYTSQVNINGAAEMQDGNVSFYANAGQVLELLYVRDSNVATVTDLKSYLAQQYAAGTPVCVWYVLSTETTGIVNEPLMRIGDYADTLSNVSIPVTAGGDTLSVGTTVQPSEVTVNYKGWHPVADVHERDNGAWT